MDADVFRCPNCGATVDIDFKTRKGFCDFCGKTVVFPRRTFNSNGKIQDDLKICLRCFEEKRFEEARKHAENVLAVAIDNGPALYARAYYEAFFAVNKNTARIGEFFRQILDIDLDGEEVEPLKKMFLATIFKLDSHEEDVLRWAEANLVPSDLCNFVDSFSAILISRRSTIDFFTPELEELYQKISASCSIPKTCFSLLQAISKNPDSPYPENRFFLKTKTQRFYNDFVLPIGEIIKVMASQELREKFYKAYQQQLNDFTNKMNGGNS